MKIAVLGGYGPTQSVGAVFRALRRAGHQVCHWPTLPTFDAGVPREPVDLLFSFKIGYDHVPRGWIESRKIPVKMLWSFDDPHWIRSVGSPWFANEHNIILTSCQQSVESYRERGCPRAEFLPPAMDLEYYHDWKGKYGVDELPGDLVSFFATNLYPRNDFPNTFIDRGEMVDRLTTVFGEAFGLYGHSGAIESKPTYRGVLHWEGTLPRHIEATQMNINTHVENTDYLYFNERFFQIASTRRAMFVDRIPGFTDLFHDDQFVFYSSLQELVDKLQYFRERRRELAEIGQRGFDRMAGWTYDAFVQQVMDVANGKAATPNFLI